MNKALGELHQKETNFRDLEEQSEWENKALKNTMQSRSRDGGNTKQDRLFQGCHEKGMTAMERKKNWLKLKLTYDPALARSYGAENFNFLHY